MNQTHKIFLDDCRNPLGTDWTIVRNSNEFKALLDKICNEMKDWIDTVSFDYELNELNWNGLGCFKVLYKRCIKYGFPMPKIIVHSGYPGVEKYFKSVADSFEMRTDQKINFQYLPRFI